MDLTTTEILPSVPKEILDKSYPHRKQKRALVDEKREVRRRCARSARAILGEPHWDQAVGASHRLELGCSARWVHLVESCKQLKVAKRFVVRVH